MKSRSKPAVGTDSLARELAGYFKALGNPTRLRMLLALLESGSLHVNGLSAAAEASPQAVSNHLQALAAKGLVRGRRSGMRVNYRLHDPRLRRLLQGVRGLR